jgi:ubiquinol-cytochrome c reductase iron-sulfur subunit
MNRRELLTRTVAVFSAAGAIGLSIPFIRSLMPSFSNEVILDVDVENLREGEIRQVRWLGRAVYIVDRGQLEEQDLASLDESLEDPRSEVSSQPSFAANRQRSRENRHLVVFANCTHLGCEVEAKRTAGEFSGFRCPCHQSDFDVAGRVEKGSAAKLNLEVPEYQYAGEHVIRLRKVEEHG